MRVPIRRARLTLSQSARMAAIIAACPTLYRPMRPPLLLRSSALQMAVGPARNCSKHQTVAFKSRNEGWQMCYRTL